jgi:hypothetical protein
MSNGIIKVDEVITTQAESEIKVGGIDSKYDVYMLQVSGITTVSGATSGLTRVTTNGTAQTGTNYDLAGLGLRTDQAYTHLTNLNYTEWGYLGAWSHQGSNSSFRGNFTAYLFNFNNANQYSMITAKSISRWANGTLAPITTGVYKVAEINDGISYTLQSDIQTGARISLYGLTNS